MHVTRPRGHGDWRTSPPKRNEVRWRGGLRRQIVRVILEGRRLLALNRLPRTLSRGMEGHLQSRRYLPTRAPIPVATAATYQFCLRIHTVLKHWRGLLQVVRAGTRDMGMHPNTDFVHRRGHIPVPREPTHSNGMYSNMDLVHQGCLLVVKVATDQSVSTERAQSEAEWPFGSRTLPNPVDLGRSGDRRSQQSSVFSDMESGTSDSRSSRAPSTRFDPIADAVRSRRRCSLARVEEDEEDSTVAERTHDDGRRRRRSSSSTRHRQSSSKKSKR